MRELPKRLPSAPPLALQPIPANPTSDPAPAQPWQRPVLPQAPVPIVRNKGNDYRDTMHADRLDASRSSRAEAYKIAGEEREEEAAIRREGRAEETAIRREGRAEDVAKRRAEAVERAKKEMAIFENNIRKDYDKYTYENHGGKVRTELAQKDFSLSVSRLGLQASELKGVLQGKMLEADKLVDAQNRAGQMLSLVKEARAKLDSQMRDEVFSRSFTTDEERDEWIQDNMAGRLPGTGDGLYWKDLNSEQKQQVKDAVFNSPPQAGAQAKMVFQQNNSDRYEALTKAESSALSISGLTPEQASAHKGIYQELANSLDGIITMGNNAHKNVVMPGAYATGRPQGTPGNAPGTTPTSGNPAKTQAGTVTARSSLPPASPAPPPASTDADDRESKAAENVINPSPDRPKNAQGEDMRSDALEGTIIAKHAKDAGRLLGEVFLEAGIELPSFSSLEEAEEWWDSQGDGMKTMVLGATGMAANTIAPALFDEARSGFKGTRNLAKSAGDMIKMPFQDSDDPHNEPKRKIQSSMGAVHEAGKSPSITSAGRQQVAAQMAQLEKLAHDHGVKPFKGSHTRLQRYLKQDIEDRYKYYSDELDKVIQKNWQKLPAKIRQKLDEDKALRESRKNSKGIKAGAAKALRGGLYGLGIGLTAHDLLKISGNHAEAKESERLLKEMQVAMDAKLAAGKIVAAERAARKLVDEDYQRGRSANQIEMSAADARDAGKITQEVYDATVRYLDETGRQQGAMSEGEDL